MAQLRRIKYRLGDEKGAIPRALPRELLMALPWVLACRGQMVKYPISFAEAQDFPKSQPLEQAATCTVCDEDFRR